MITRKEKLETYTSRIREFLDHRSMQIAEVTNQEVAETLGDDVFIEQNTHTHTSPPYRALCALGGVVTY